MESDINSEIFTEIYAKLVIAAGVCTTPIIEISPARQKPPLETPVFGTCVHNVLAF